MNRVVEVAVCAMAVLLMSSAVHGQGRNQKAPSNTDATGATCRTDVHGTKINQHYRWEYNMEIHLKKDKCDEAQQGHHKALCITTGDEVHWASNKSSFTLTITPASGCPPLFPNAPSTVPQSSQDLGPTSVTKADCQYEVAIKGVDPHIIVNSSKDHRHDHDGDGKKGGTAPAAKPKQK